MIRHFDHVTIVVRDTEEAKAFFALLGFVEQQTVVISGVQFSAYMGIPGIEAEHVTLALGDASPHLEIQLLRYRHPQPIVDPDILKLNKLGFNHICFAVDDIEAEVRRLTARGRSDAKRRHAVSRSQTRLPLRTRRNHGGTCAMAEQLMTAHSGDEWSRLLRSRCSAW